MKIICRGRCYFVLCYCYEQRNISKFFSMKLIHTRTNQLRYFKQTVGNYRNRVYEFGVFYDTYIISGYKSGDRLQYDYQLKDSFSLHLMSLIKDNFLEDVNRIITLLNYHNCLYYNHNKFGLNRFASYKTSYHDKRNKRILNRIYDILVWGYNLSYNIKFKFKLALDRTFKLVLDGVYIDVDSFYKVYKIIGLANQDLINMVYEIAQQNEKIEKKLTFAVIYNLFLR